MKNTQEIAIVGAGMAGLMSAYFLAKAGQRVTLFEKNTIGSGTSYFAAGMLAPISELEFSEPELLHAGLKSRAIYDELEADLGEIGLIRAGTLELGLDKDDVSYLRRSFDFQKKLGLNVEWIDADRITELEPFVSRNIPFAIHSPDDIQIDHFILLDVLRQKLPEMGVELRENEEVLDMEELSAGQFHLSTNVSGSNFDKIVFATGAFQQKKIQYPYKIYPVRGEVLSLIPPETPFLDMTIRIRNQRFGDAYIVPKKGCLILGSTSEEKGFNQKNSLGGVMDIMRKCYAAVPGLYELEIMELGAGLRPGLLDRSPLIDKEENREVYHVNGLFRHGILLSPLAGKTLASMVLENKRIFAAADFGFRKAIL